MISSRQTKRSSTVVLCLPPVHTVQKLFINQRVVIRIMKVSDIKTLKEFLTTKATEDIYWRMISMNLLLLINTKISVHYI